MRKHSWELFRTPCISNWVTQTSDTAVTSVLFSWGLGFVLNCFKPQRFRYHYNDSGFWRMKKLVFRSVRCLSLYVHKLWTLYIQKTLGHLIKWFRWISTKKTTKKQNHASAVLGRRQECFINRVPLVNLAITAWRRLPRYWLGMKLCAVIFPSQVVY